MTHRRKSSPLDTDEARAVEMMEGVPNFEALFGASRKTVNEVQDILTSFLNSEEAIDRSIVEALPVSG